MITVGICDNDIYFINYFYDLLKKISSELVILCYSSIDKLIEDAHSINFKVFFINVELKDCNSMRRTVFLNQICPTSSVVFISNSADAKNPQVIFTQDRHLKPSGYLIKPPDNNILKKLVSFLILDVTDKNIGSFVVKTIEDGNVTVEAEKICYIEHKNRISTLNLKSGKQLKCRRPLSFFEQYLPMNRFLYAQKSYIVNAAEVKSFCNGEIILSENTSIFTSRGYNSSFKEKLNVYRAAQ